MSRIGQRIQTALQDGKVSLKDIEDLKKTAMEDGRVSKAETRELEVLLKPQNADKFEPGAQAKLRELLGGSPAPTTPTTPVTTPVVTQPTTPQVPVKPAPKTPVADPTVLTKHAGTTYGTIDGGKLFVDGVSYDDVVQGSIGDCYLAAALSSVAHADPKLIENAIKDNGDGTFDVRFFEAQGYSGPMKAVTITIDGDLPTNGTQSTKYAKARDGKELWPALIEKAYASWKGGYEAIGNGGIAGDVTQALSGKRAGYTNTKFANGDAVFRQIQEGAKSHRPMAAGTHGKDSGVDYTGSGVYAWHMYTVLGAVEEGGAKYVQLRNPWGSSEHGSDGKNDGIFKMEMSTFLKLYQGVTVG